MLASLPLALAAIWSGPIARRHTIEPVTICCPGGGVFFWWQIGALRTLVDMYDLPENVAVSGASAGALAACLGSCAIDLADAYRRAFELADQADVMRNPLGLCGQWGQLVHRWLDDMLPADAASRCSGRCRVIVTRCTPYALRADTLDHFESRDQLIDALMASTHIPLFMDGRLTSPRLGGRTLDGALLSFLRVHSPHSLLLGDHAGKSRAVMLTHRRDEAFVEACRAHGWTPLGIQGTAQFMEFGARYVEREAALGSEGHLAALEQYRRVRRPSARFIASMGMKSVAKGQALPPKAAHSRYSSPQHTSTTVA